MCVIRHAIISYVLLAFTGDPISAWKIPSFNYCINKGGPSRNADRQIFSLSNPVPASQPESQPLKSKWLF